MQKHWSKVEYLHESVKNKNIILKGTKSYYSNAWTTGFEDYCVRYLYGDEYSLKAFNLQWEADKLYIGNYVSIGAEAVIVMGGNNTHRTDWFSLYPFAQKIKESYKSKGDTHIGDGVWLGMRAMIMPGVHIGEGAVVAAGAIVTKDLEPYCLYAGAPAKLVRKRFSDEIIKRLLALKIYEKSEKDTDKLLEFLCSDDIDGLEKEAAQIR